MKKEEKNELTLYVKKIDVAASMKIFLNVCNSFSKESIWFELPDAIVPKEGSNKHFKLKDQLAEKLTLYIRKIVREKEGGKSWPQIKIRVKYSTEFQSVGGTNPDPDVLPRQWLELHIPLSAHEIVFFHYALHFIEYV